MSDGFEIHYDDKRQYLELACEPDAFAPYRKIAKEHLADFPEINIDEVIEINIVDTAEYVARHEAPKKRLWETIIISAISLVLGLAGIGAISIVRRIAP